MGSNAAHPKPQPARRIAVAVPARDEAEDLPACLAALDRAAADSPGPVTILILLNDCTDASAAIVAHARLAHATLHGIEVGLLPGQRHAGTARRLAFDAAATYLREGRDLLMSTDADTCVDRHWFARTVQHVEGGAEAVAGRALTRRDDRLALGVAAARRLTLLGRYYTALDWLRARQFPDPADPWPRHYYEGGASIALTLDLYRRIGGAPTPPLAEDRALFDRVRAVGGHVRHPLDVRVFTSCRTAGRAPGGMADAYAGWIAQSDDAALHETYALPAALHPAAAAADDCLSFRTLPAALAEAQRHIRASAPPPQVQPIAFVPVGAEHAHIVAQPCAKPLDCGVAGLGIVGFAGPVDEQHIAA